jgi:DNA (cytosine-5)-methyltransferase 1
LYLAFIKYLKFYRPKVFVLENVIGLLSYKKKDGSKIIDSMIKALSEHYFVEINKVCCSDFDVPQRRKRIFIIGVRKDLGLPFPDLKKHPCDKSLRYFLLPKDKVPNSYFLSAKAISGILRRQKINAVKGNGFGAQYLDLNFFCNTVTANY